MTAIVLTGSPTDLSVLEELTPSDLFAPDGTLPVFEAIKNEVAVFVPDITTPKGRKEVSALAYKISQSKNFLDKVGKAFNADLKEKTKAVDAERKAIWDKLEELQETVRAPLTKWEQDEEDRVQGHKNAINDITLAAVGQYRDAAHIKESIALMHTYDTRDWQEFNDVGAKAVTDTLQRLEEKLTVAEQAERDKEELERLRAAKSAQDIKDADDAAKKKTEEDRVRMERDAAEKAQRDAEAAIQAEKNRAAKREAEAAADLKASEERVRKAEEARIAAEAKAALEAEAAVEAERKRVAAEKKREEDAATARENDRAHHAKINNEVMAALVKLDCVLGEVPAKAITVAIASSQIPHVKISY